MANTMQRTPRLTPHQVEVLERVMRRIGGHPERRVAASRRAWHRGQNVIAMGSAGALLHLQEKGYLQRDTDMIEELCTTWGCRYDAMPYRATEKAEEWWARRSG